MPALDFLPVPELTLEADQEIMRRYAEARTLLLGCGPSDWPEPLAGDGCAV